MTWRIDFWDKRGGGYWMPYAAYQERRKVLATFCDALLDARIYQTSFRDRLWRIFNEDTGQFIVLQ